MKIYINTKRIEIICSYNLGQNRLTNNIVSKQEQRKVSAKNLLFRRINNILYKAKTIQ